MKKLFFSVLVITTLALTAFSQSEKMLDEKISQAVVENLPEWKAENPSKSFKLINISPFPDIEAAWLSENMKLQMSILLTKSDKEIEDYFRIFSNRQIMPQSRAVKDLGDREAELFETSKTVEIIFAKANAVYFVSLYFPDERKNKKIPHYYLRAPEDKIQAALKFARVAAGAAGARINYTACENDFFAQALPKPNTAQEKLYAAVLNADRETIKSLVAQNVNLRTKFAGGETALHLAVKQGCLETVKILIAAKADANSADEKGATPLMLAANLDDLEMSMFLISAGADVKMKDADGRNAAFYAVDYGRAQRRELNRNSFGDKKDILKVLQTANLDLKEKETSGGETLLTFWMKRSSGENDFINFLLDSGVDINAANADGRSALIIAALNSNDRSDRIRLLLKRGANVNQRDAHNNRTALGHLSAERKNYLGDASTLQKIDETIKILKDAGAVE